MDTILEEPKEIPIIGNFDICVIGGSCTGVFAAVSAARLGQLKTGSATVPGRLVHGAAVTIIALTNVAR